MNYIKHYNRLIERAKNRTLDGYKERHHILPRCLGGSDDPENLVDLTAEEHFVAHQLLVRIYPGQEKLVFALHMMTRTNDFLSRNNKLYSWIRKKVSDARKGKPCSEETRRKISESNKGKSAPNKGVPMSEEQKLKLSKKLKGSVPWNLGKPMSEETKQKLSETLTGRVVGEHSQETKEKISKKLKGNKNGLGNKSRSGQKLSEETRQKMREAHARRKALKDSA